MSNTPATADVPAAQPDWSKPQSLATGAAVVGLGLYAIVGGINLASDTGKRDLLTSFLSAWVFWLSLPLGGMALLMIHYLAKTSWGIFLKRPLEAATRTWPLLAALFVPFAALAMTAGKDSPYWWVDPANAATVHADAHKDDHKGEAAKGKDDHATGDAKWDQRKAMSDAHVKNMVAHERHEREVGNYSFLSPTVFVACSVAYFAIWGAFIFFLNKWSQDAETDPTKVESSLEKLKNISGPGLIVFAISATAAATHWVMSVQEGWSSTMFPVIFAVNTFLTTFAFCVAIFLLLASRPPFKDLMRPKFQLDMGSLMLAFTLFWSYTSFSQMMLIWIGNLPEEIPFYLKRSDAFWWWVSAALIVFHFGVPFILLLFRDVKLHPVRLRMMAVYLLVVCAIDVVWWIEPTYIHKSPVFILMDVGALVGIGGVWGLFFLFQLKKRPLLPMNEVYQLPEGHDEHH